MNRYDSADVKEDSFRINGQILFYLEQRRYGYIHGEDGERYFFHKNSVTSRGTEIDVGLFVDFTPDVSPKGYIASNVNIREVDPSDMLYEVPKKLIRTRDGEVKGWQIINTLDKIISVKSKDLQEVRSRLEEVASAINANAVINETYKRTSDTDDGRYYYAVHNLSGTPVQVARLNPKGGFNLNDFADMHTYYQKWKKEQEEKEKLERFEKLILVAGVIGIGIFLMCVLR
jgi:cold shock CspA family protein